MKVAGIIAEYNPFHNGHQFHIEQTRTLTGSDYVVCAMSGNFTQRGAPAMADKWVRARMALAGGADAVFELPFLHATQSAEGFASGGVKLLTALGADTLSFGSESGDIRELQRCAGFLFSNAQAMGSAIKEQLALGLSYAAAREQAARSLGFDAAAFAQPNNILGIEYIKAILAQRSPLAPFTLRREGSGYADETLNAAFPSARALRLALAEGADISGYIPRESLSFLPEEPAGESYYVRLLLYKLRMMTAEEIGLICDVSEGLEYKIKEAARSAQSYGALIMAIKSKRYSYTRIARILLYCLLDVTKKLARRANTEALSGIRLLGFRRQSEALISHLAATSAVPVVTKASEFPPHLLFEADIRATDIYSLLYKKAAPAGRDYTEKLIVL